MKTLILLMFPIAIFAQSDTTALKYSEVVKVDSATKNELYERARLWFTDYYKSGKAVLQISDKETGELTGKPLITTYYSFKVLGSKNYREINTHPTLRILVKDGKYKYELYDFYDPDLFKQFTTAETSPVKVAMQRQNKTDAWWVEAKEHLNNEAKSIATSLYKYMTNQGVKKDEF